MPRSGLFRLLVGIGISVAFLALVLARVDLGQVGDALVGVAPAGLARALGVVGVDRVIRASRWQALLRAIVPGPAAPRLRLAVAYLTVGFLANSLLPARLGDVARAYLAGTTFGTSRLATFGTILIERVADGLTMVVLAVLSSLVVVGLAEVRILAIEAVLLVLGGSVGVWLVWLALSAGPIGRTRWAAVLRDLLARLGAGAAAIRHVRGAAFVGALTIAAAGTASVVCWIVAGAMGLGLTAPQVVLFTSGIALSLAIPAAPGSLGTYEFAGVLILSSFGATAERALATVLVMRLVSTVPLALAGLVATWVLHLRPTAIFALDGEDGTNRRTPPPDPRAKPAAR
jgi:uncharacterized membrane protein YbhN (UPF0104 family)